MMIATPNSQVHLIEGSAETESNRPGNDREEITAVSWHDDPSTARDESKVRDRKPGYIGLTHCCRDSRIISSVNTPSDAESHFETLKAFGDKAGCSRRAN